MQSPRTWFVFLLVLIGCLTSLTLCQECNPPVADCTCPRVDVLECTGLDQLPESLPAKVTSFNCIACRLQVLNSTVLPFPTVTSLALTDSQIHHIDDNAFQAMTSLKTLDLSSNQLHHLKKGMFLGLSALDTLHLRGCRIQEVLHDAFQDLPSLREVDMSDNGEIELPKEVFKGSPIQALILRDCKLNALPLDLLKGLGTLTKLDLDRNSFRKIPANSFSTLHELQELSLNKCEIQDLEIGAFAGLDKVDFLNIGYNNLSRLEVDTFKPLAHKTLKKVYLEHNQLMSIPYDLLLWKNLNELKVYGNPWECNCDIRWMSDLPQQSLGPENVTCWLPEELRGDLVQNATMGLDCPDSPDSTGGSVVALAIVIPIVLICVCLIGWYIYKVYRRRQDTTKRNMHYQAVYRDTTENTRHQNKNPPPRPPRPVSEL